MPVSKSPKAKAKTPTDTPEAWRQWLTEQQGQEATRAWGSAIVKGFEQTTHPEVAQLLALRLNTAGIPSHDLHDLLKYAAHDGDNLRTEVLVRAYASGAYPFEDYVIHAALDVGVRTAVARCSADCIRVIRPLTRSHTDVHELMGYALSNDNVPVLDVLLPETTLDAFAEHCLELVRRSPTHSAHLDRLADRWSPQALSKIVQVCEDRFATMFTPRMVARQRTLLEAHALQEQFENIKTKPASSRSRM